MTISIQKPALWLLILIVGLPQLSETIYTPSLPEIALYLRTTPEMVEYTLSIYLLGFGIGTFFWGILSDSLGRRPCVLMGLFLYSIGCILCLISGTIESLLMARFIQALGGSIGSVLGQAMCRDAFHGPERSTIYASIGAALSFAPAIGPIMGGVTAQYLGWRSIFVFLFLFGMLTFLISSLKLPETHSQKGHHKESLIHLAKKLLRDRHILHLGFLIGAANGLMFSYYGEGSFYLIEMLGLTPSFYGISFLVIAGFGMCGARVTRSKIKKGILPLNISRVGIYLCLSSSCFFLFCVMTRMIHGGGGVLSIAFTLLSVGGIFFSMGMMLPPALSVALENYQYAVGRASSIFGLYYYLIVSFVTYMMGEMRNGTLFAMPIYFMVISGCLLISFLWGTKKDSND